MIDTHDDAVSEEFYDNLITCDIKSVDCLISALHGEPSAIQRVKGTIYGLALFEKFSTEHRK